MDIVIVGAGVFGAWTALSCARAGHRVTLLDRLGPANSKSSSTGESRVIRSAYGPDEVYTRMARRSLHLWHKFFQEEHQLECFRQTGVLWMARAEEPSTRQARAIFDRLNILYDWLDAAAISRRYPQFKISGDTVALFEPEAGALLAERSVEAVIACALRAGVRYEVAELRPPVINDARLNSIETLDGKRFSADQFLFACGSWLPKLFGVLKEVIRPTRQDFFFFGLPDGSDQFRPGMLPIWIDQTDPKIAYGFPDLGNGMKM